MHARDPHDAHAPEHAVSSSALQRGQRMAVIGATNPQRGHVISTGQLVFGPSPEPFFSLITSLRSA
jgi:hypothetical protein